MANRHRLFVSCDPLVRTAMGRDCLASTENLEEFEVETADHSRQGLQLMKRFAPIAAIAAGSLLLVGCQSKRETCAQFKVNSFDSAENVDYWKRLGIERPMPEGNPQARRAIERFCEFYKS